MADSKSFQTAFGRQGMCYVYGLIVLAPTLLWPQAHNFSAGLDENRDKSEIPALAAAIQDPVDAVCDFRDYYNDSFPFREAAIAVDSAIRFDGLDVRWKNRVSIGEDGWLFLRENRHHAPVTLPVPDFSTAQLDAWLNVFARRQAAVEEGDAKYVVVVAPNKATVYADKRPSNLRPIRPDGRLLQLQQGLQQHGISCIDILAALRAARDEGTEIYYRTDTHWNVLGAGLAAREILTQLGRFGIVPKTVGANLLADREVTRDPNPFTGDLLRLLGATETPREHWMRFEPDDGYKWEKIGCPQYANVRLPQYMHTFATKSEDQTLPRAVVFRDSFTLDLQLFLSDAFSRSVYVWDYAMDMSVVEAERPDIVLDIFVERRLNSPVPSAFYSDAP